MSESSYPTAFVSYSWDNDSHKRWVADLGTRLRRDGIDTRLDQWHAAPGDQLPHFMEREIRENHYVIVICTPNYKRKSDNRMGGVGYEGDIMTAEVFTTKNQRKFIPILASGTWLESAPSWLAGKYFVDLSDSAKFDQNYQDLLSTIIGRRTQAPPLGPAPVNFTAPKHNQPAPKPAQQSMEIRILGVIVDEVTEPRLDGTRGSALYRVPFRLSRRPSSEWIELFLRAWEMPSEWTSMHRPGIADVEGDRIILDGTTIEEVQRYHKKTLTLCVNEANNKEAEWRKRAAQQQALEEQRSHAHRKTVSDIASQINFDDEA